MDIVKDTKIIVNMKYVLYIKEEQIYRPGPLVDSPLGGIMNSSGETFTQCVVFILDKKEPITIKKDKIEFITP